MAQYALYGYEEMHSDYINLRLSWSVPERSLLISHNQIYILFFFFFYSALVTIKKVKYTATHRSNKRSI